MGKALNDAWGGGSKAQLATSVAPLFPTGTALLKARATITRKAVLRGKTAPHDAHGMLALGWRGGCRSMFRDGKIKPEDVADEGVKDGLITEP